MDSLTQLVERVEKLGSDLACPLCGEEGFDAVGISQHWTRWCVVERAIDGLRHRTNADVAAALKARGGE